MVLYRLLFMLAASLLAPGTRSYIFNPKSADTSVSRVTSSIPIDLSIVYNNRGFGKTPGDANLDGNNASYPADELPPPSFVYQGIKFAFPQYREAGDDNVLALGQTIEVPRGRYQSAYLLAASENGLASSSLNATYADGSRSSGALLVPAWWTWPYPAGGDIIMPYFNSPVEKNFNRSMIYLTQNWLDSSKEVTAITLPNVTEGADSGPGGSAIKTRLHIFALSLLEAPESKGPRLEVQYAASTPSWIEGTNKTQIIDVIINNVGDEWVLAHHGVRISAKADGLETVVPGVINRLRPGDRARVTVGVVNKAGVAAGTAGTARIVIGGHGLAQSVEEHQFSAIFGIAPYEATYESIYSHPPAPWYNAAKYGIFIHWGPYAVPGWGNTGKRESYAEWYWWSMNGGPDDWSQTWEYHNKTWGPDVVYDDFIPMFSASRYDAKAWVDLFADAGAKYFVSVSKHHDGYAIFDLPETVSKRTSVAMTPHRNLLQELFDAAEQHQPHLHKATYFSLPEWFHPDYRKYGFSAWPGGNATNPYTNKTLPYAGYVPVDDYISDVVIPSMEVLADMGTEIMWCDIGGPNMTAEFASAWFNKQAELGRQVVLNARCGLPGDFDTPEYAKYSAILERKWESNLGMDPNSYGYNRATPLELYMKPQDIVTSLVDIVSKNGNFLLDIGPTEDGTILEVMQNNLREAGAWIKSHEEAIFDTTYWFVTPSDGDNIRFTQTTDAFYILVMAKPQGTIVIKEPVPFVMGDEVVVVGGNATGTLVPSRLLEGGVLELTISDDISNSDRFTWVFKIPF